MMILPCECGCKVLRFTADKELKLNFLSVEAYSSDFYTKQDGIFGVLFERIKFCWNILLGNGFRLYDMVFDEKQIGDLRKFLDDVE